MSLSVPMQAGFATNGLAHGGAPLIQVSGLVKQFGGLRAVDGMSMMLRRGEMVGLIGPNGAGKTTLFNLIAGALKPTSGQIRVADIEISGEGAGLLVQIRPQMGLDLLLPLFAAAILGGIGSVPGAMLAGLIVGLAEALAVQLIGAEWRSAIAFVILVMILLLRPQGLFGRRE